MKHVFIFLIFAHIGSVAAQTFPFNGYELTDHLVTAIHPNGCSDEYITGWPDDSIWVNMDDYTLTIGNFGSEWTDQPGDELLLETGYHPSNYDMFLNYKSGSFSETVTILQQDWTELPDVDWNHIFNDCDPDTDDAPQYILALDFALFGTTSNDTVIGLTIIFLPTTGVPDLAGAYIMIPTCPELDLGPDITLCSEETATIDATIPFASYQWHDGYTSAVYPNAGPGTYWVDVTTLACFASDTIHIIATEEPPLLGNDTQLCLGESLQLDVTTPGATYEWQDQSTEPTYLVTQSGLYAVTITVQDCEYTDAIQVEVLDPSDFDLGNDTTLCAGQTLSLDAFVQDATYQWQDNNFSSSYTVTDPGFYAVTVTLSECTAEDEIQINYTYPEQANLGSDIILCEGQTVDLIANIEDATFLWQDFSTDSSITVYGPGIYSVTITIDGCSTSDEVQVLYNFPEQVDLGPDLILCPGETVDLIAFVEDATYLWQDFSTDPIFTVSEPGLYSVTITVDDCFTSDEVQILYNNSEQVNIGPDLILCAGDTIDLNAFTENATYLWQDFSTGSNFHVSEPGIYSVTVTVNGCSTSDEVTVSYFQENSFNLGPDTVLCSGSSYLLNATTPGATYQWQDQSSNATYLVSMPGQYIVVVNVGGCTTTDTVAVSFANLLNITLGPDTILCPAETLILYPGIPNAMYQWQDQSTTDSLLVSQSGEYYVQVSIGNCIARDTIHVEYPTLTTPNIGNDTTLCEGATLTLDASTINAPLEWHDHTTGPTWLVNGPGIYWVTATMQGCSTTDTIHVDYISFTSINLGADTILCEGENLILDATLAGSSYNWQDQTTSPIYLATQPGSYWVQVSTANCHVSDTIQIEFQFMPPLYLGNDTTLCDGQSLTLDASSQGAQYLWQDGSTQPMLSIFQPGTYLVQVSTGVCETKDTIEITYHPVPTVDLGSDTTLCDGDILIIQAGSSGLNYEWHDQSMLQSFTVVETGEYSVTVSDGLCKASDTLFVAYLNVQGIQLGADTVLCDGKVLILDANAPGAQYHWQDNSHSSTFVVTQPGVYWVQVNLAECLANDTILVDYYLPVVIDLGMDTTLCPGEIITLSAETPGATYKWQDQSMQDTYEANQEGSYWVEIDVMGCLASDTINVFYRELPLVILGNDTVLCYGDTMLLQGIIPGAQYTWQDNSMSSSFSVSSPGIYTVEVLLHPCVTNDTILIGYNSQVSLNLGEDQTLCEGENILLTPELTAGVEYLWQDHSSGNTYLVSITGEYWLQVSDECGVYADTIFIHFENCAQSIYVPNIFSPNGDGINDFLVPQYNATIESYTFRIYDRFGGLLFETQTLGEGWDGDVRETPAQSGVYTYVLEYTFEEKPRQHITGDLTLVR